MQYFLNPDFKLKNNSKRKILTKSQRQLLCISKINAKNFSFNPSPCKSTIFVTKKKTLLNEVLSLYINLHRRKI